MAKVGMISAQTPNFLISMDDIFSEDTGGSTIVIDETAALNDLLEDCTILYTSKFSVRKVIAPDAGHDLFSSARLQGSLLHVTIASGAYVADLENYFATGRVIDETKIIKLSNVNGTGIPVDINLFENCYIVEIAPAYDSKTNMDLYRMEIRYNKRTHTIRQYGQDGLLKGQNVSEYDFALNTIATAEEEDSGSEDEEE